MTSVAKLSTVAVLAALCLAWPRMASAAPQIKCTVGTASWCLAAFDGSVRMHDTPDSRIWELHARGAEMELPMVITETKECSDTEQPKLVLLAENHERSAGRVMHRYKYRLDTNGCTLEFTLPESSAYTEYKQFMLFGVLVGPTKRTQLYKAARK